MAKRKRLLEPSEKIKYRSQLEKKLAATLPAHVRYEPDRIQYKIEHFYTPDFKIKNNVYIEAKGFWRSEDRTKHLYIKEQHPEIIIYFMFQNPDLRLSRTSSTTYAQWADKHGFKWSTLDKGIPKEWLL